MKRTILLSCAVCLFGVNSVFADLIRGIDIEFVTIGNSGNSGDTRTGIHEQYGFPMVDPYGCGAVGYEYRIGKYEITNAQWNAFVNRAGTPTGDMEQGYDESAEHTGDQQPANCVSWAEAAQFCNWLTSGDKSKGVYQFSGTNENPGSLNFSVMNRQAAQALYGTIYFLPTEDEWYKAAYYRPDGSGYSFFANGTDNTTPIAGVDANYENYDETIETPNIPWQVGSGAIEQNGTYDMMGNVWEWNESRAPIALGIRGGAYDIPLIALTSGWQYQRIPWDESGNVGFRVASVPEPATLLLLGLGGMMARKKAKK